MGEEIFPFLCGLSIPEHCSLFIGKSNMDAGCRRFEDRIEEPEEKGLLFELHGLKSGNDPALFFQGDDHRVLTAAGIPFPTGKIPPFGRIGKDLQIGSCFEFTSGRFCRSTFRGLGGNRKVVKDG